MSEIIHSIHCGGYRGVGVPFDDDNCSCGATVKHLRTELADEKQRFSDLIMSSMNGHPDPCTLGPLCPYCEIARLKNEIECLKSQIDGLTFDSRILPEHGL